MYFTQLRIAVVVHYQGSTSWWWHRVTFPQGCHEVIDEPRNDFVFPSWHQNLDRLLGKGSFSEGFTRVEFS